MDMPDTVIKRIVVDRMERCRVCHHVFVPDDVHVLSRNSEMWMMVVTCTECHDRKYVAAMLSDGDPEQARLAMRAPRERPERGDDVPAERRSPPVSGDDVLDMHEFLRDFDGDFLNLFRGR
jgi:hypothetical protein